MQLIKIHDLHFTPLISEKAIKNRVAEIGKLLTEKMEGRTPIYISILSGAFVFASDLIRAYSGDCEINFVKLSSYEGTESTGRIKTILDISKEKIHGRDLIVVEDIIDSGQTMHFFLQHLQHFEPASVTTVTFLVKPDALKVDVQIDYFGFEIGNDFVVGYGLDYDGLGRNLPEIYVLHEK